MAQSDSGRSSRSTSLIVPPVPAPPGPTNPSSSIPHRDLDDHLAELSTFLTLHITNLTALKNQLAPNAHSPPSDAVIAANRPERNLADQFNVIVVTVSSVNIVLEKTNGTFTHDTDRPHSLLAPSLLFCP